MPVVTGDDLPKPVLVHEFVSDSGFTFFKVCKNSTTVQNLVGVHPNNKTNDRRPLSSTDIVEKLIECRDAQYAALSRASMSQAELGLDAPPLKKHRRKITLPSFVVVNTPQFDGIESVSMRVLLSSPCRPLFIELIPANIVYLRSVVNMQIAAGDIKRMHPRHIIPPEERVKVPVGETGISAVYSGTLKGWLRVKIIDGQNEVSPSKTKNKYIKPDPEADLSNDVDMVDKAIAFKRSTDSSDFEQGSTSPVIDEAVDNRSEQMNGDHDDL